MSKSVSISQAASETHTGTISGSYRINFSGFSGSRLRYFSVYIATASTGANQVTLYSDSNINHLTNTSYSFEVNATVTWTGNNTKRFLFGKISWQMDPTSDTTGNRATSSTSGDIRFSSNLQNNVWASLPTNWISDTDGASVSGTFTLYKS